MYSTRKPLRDRLCASSFAVMIGLLALPAVATAQVRTKKPDRGVYQPPLITSVSVEPAARPDQPQDAEPEIAEPEIAELVRDDAPIEGKKRRRELVEVTLDIYGEPSQPAEITARYDVPIADQDAPTLQRVGHEDVILLVPLVQGVIGEETIVQADETTIDGGVIWDEGNIIHDETCDGCSGCTANDCDAIGCDSMGCDSMGCSIPWYRKWENSSLSLDSNHWFGSVELLLMFRRGDRLPPLVTTDTNPDPDIAGQLPDAPVLVGRDTILKDITAGGRLTLGTWIDDQQCRSLVLRAWFAGEETFGFNANQDQFPVLARPFFNVSDNQAAEQDALLIAFPDRASGSVNVRASSDVFGGDVSVRQFFYGKYGGTVDLLYGYQYMRMNEDLSISSTSISLDDDFAPLGSVISVADAFDVQNEFHGGQLGVASRYRERCWSFNALAKVGFGSLQRRAKLSGATVTSVDGSSAFDPNGLLVRSTNSGTVTDHTFAWVPELDLSIGWHRYPRFDLTLGYHIIAMTDALQISDAIDSNLAVNLSDPPTGQQRPALLLRYNTFYVQGIHFGLQYAY